MLLVRALQKADDKKPPFNIAYDEQGRPTLDLGLESELSPSADSQPARRVVVDKPASTRKEHDAFLAEEHARKQARAEAQEKTAREDAKVVAGYTGEKPQPVTRSHTGGDPNKHDFYTSQMDFIPAGSGPDAGLRVGRTKHVVMFRGKPAGFATVHHDTQYSRDIKAAEPTIELDLPGYKDMPEEERMYRTVQAHVDLKNHLKSDHFKELRRRLKKQRLEEMAADALQAGKAKEGVAKDVARAKQEERSAPAAPVTQAGEPNAAPVGEIKTVEPQWQRQDTAVVPQLKKSESDGERLVILFNGQWTLR